MQFSPCIAISLIGECRLISKVEREAELDDLDVKAVIANARDVAGTAQIAAQMLSEIL